MIGTIKYHYHDSSTINKVLLGTTEHLRNIILYGSLVHTLDGGVEYALRMAPRRAHALLCTWAAFRLGPVADEADADEQDAARRPTDDDGLAG